MFSKKHRLFIMVIAILLAIGSTLTAYAAGNSSKSYASGVFYVSASNGSDGNDGTQANPWRTIQKAADSVAPGDVVIVLAGNYSERVVIQYSGAAEAPITFQAQGTVVMQGFSIYADHVTIKGFEVTNTPNDYEHGVGIFVQGSDCILDDNYIHFATWGGILANPTSSNCIIRNNRLYRNSQMGIEVNGLNHLVEGNEIWGTIQHHPAWSDSFGWLDADGIKFFGTGHVLRGNYIHDILYSDPENINPHIDYFQTFSGGDKLTARDILIEQNHCDNPQAQSGEDSGTGFMIELAEGDILIRNNLVRAFVGAYVNQTSGVTIVNNTFVSDLAFNTSFWPVGVTILSSSGATIQNNIFYNHPWRVIDVDGVSSLQGGYNLVYRSDGNAPIGEQDPNDLWGVDPLFVDPADEEDFTLQTNSPAIDAGAPLATLNPHDYYGIQRPQGTGFDIGAYELEQSSSQPPRVESIIRADASPTGSSSVNYIVTFSQSVTGVDAGDFSLTTTGDLSGVSIINLTGFGTTYTVLVDTGVGNGTIRLDLTSNSIVNENGDPLEGAGSIYFEGEVYTIEKSPAPENDDFDFAKDVSTLGYDDTLDTRGATVASDDPDVTSCGVETDAATVWYKHTPSSDSAIALNTSSADYDTFIAIWTGTRGDLSLVACNDDIGDAIQAKVAFSVTAGTTYYIEIGQSVKIETATPIPKKW